MQTVSGVVSLIGMAILFYGFWRYGKENRSIRGLKIIFAGVFVCVPGMIGLTIATHQEISKTALAEAMTGVECTAQGGRLEILSGLLAPKKTICLMPDGSQEMVRVPKA